tara:strand:- start:324 stop:533 length:210 start_codon:yes stop_codon:yes gene_type:complete
MITLTTLQGEQFILNADEIERVIHSGDTIVICRNGMRVRVRENFDSIVNKSINYQQKKHHMPVLVNDKE